MNGRSPYIVGPVYDWCLFLLPPLVALGVGIAISGTSFTDQEIEIGGRESTWAALAIGTIIQAHLVAVLFRSHGNHEIFRLYKVRFVAVPIVLYLAMVSSQWVAVSASVLATLWDVWHSGAQTFGFGRIYERNHGNEPQHGRRLDFWLNQILYAGPIVGGVTLIDHIDRMKELDSIGATFFVAVPALGGATQRWLTWGMTAAGAIFLVAYVVYHARLRRRGYRPSPLKVFLYVSTGACSIYSWGFNSWGEAFFIMNMFHAVQYLALVWAIEHKRWVGWLRLGPAPVAALFLGAVVAYGWGVQLVDPDVTSLWAVTIVVSLMHFWYDGFIWSVRKKQV